MPATTAGRILEGFGTTLESHDVLDVFASHGMSHGMRRIGGGWDFSELNRRLAGWEAALRSPTGEAAERIDRRFDAVRLWLRSGAGARSSAIDASGMRRPLFFHWWGSFRRLGLAGLADPGAEVFRRSKILPEAEARMVVDKLQNPSRPDSHYVERLRHKGMDVQRDAIAKVGQSDSHQHDVHFVRDMP